jgi:hypothetical protein
MTWPERVLLLRSPQWWVCSKWMSLDLLRRLCINSGWSAHTTTQSYVSILWGKIHSKRDMHFSCSCVQLAWIAHRRIEVTVSSLAMSHIFDTQCIFNLSTWYMSATEVNKAKHCNSQWSTRPFRGGVHTSSSVNTRCKSLTAILNDLHCNAYEFWMVSMLESIWNRLNQIGIIRWHLITTHHHKVHTTRPPTSSKQIR